MQNAEMDPGKSCSCGFCRPSRDSTGHNSLEMLPVEVLLKILDHTDAPSLICFALTSRANYALVKGDKSITSFNELWYVFASSVGPPC